MDMEQSVVPQKKKKLFYWKQLWTSQEVIFVSYLFTIWKFPPPPQGVQLIYTQAIKTAKLFDWKG